MIPKGYKYTLKSDNFVEIVWLSSEKESIKKGKKLLLLELTLLKRGLVYRKIKSEVTKVVVLVKIAGNQPSVSLPFQLDQNRHRTNIFKFIFWSNVCYLYDETSKIKHNNNYDTDKTNRLAWKVRNVHNVISIACAPNAVSYLSVLSMPWA